MNEVDVSGWVEQADVPQRRFREAVHIILDAIGQSRSLQTKMVMKGGLLMAIRYASTRLPGTSTFRRQASIGKHRHKS